MAANPKFRWQEQDPKTGLDFSLWKQFSHKVSSADDCVTDAVFVKSNRNNGGTCFHYEVVDAICVAIEFKVDEETATYGWSYAGGCFEDGRIANYVSATPGRDYNFDKLDFEVREYNPGLLESAGSWFSLSGLFSLLALLCLVGAIVAGVVLAIQFNKGRKQLSGEEKAFGGDVQMASVKDKNKHQEL